MNHRTEIGKRIKKLRQENNHSQTYVASILFISQAAYSLIESSQNGIVVDHILKLSQLYGVTCDYILRGERNLIKVGRDSGFIPLVRAHAHAGFLNSIDDDISFDIKDWFRIPGFDPTRDQTLFQVDGESMTPTIFPGDVLICQAHNNLDQVLDGSAVVVITVDSVLVKRLRTDKDREYLLVENDNPGQSEKRRIKKDDIKKIMMIRGKISGVLVPHHEITSKGKMQELEESVNILKNELFSMSKKLNALTRKN